MKKVLTIAMAALMSMAAMAQNDSKFSTDRLQKLTSRAEMQKHQRQRQAPKPDAAKFMHDGTATLQMSAVKSTKAAGDTVWVVKGSPMVERIASLSREIGDTIYVHVDELYGPEQLMMMVSAGEIRYAVVNRSIARAMASRLPNLNRSVAISLSQFQSWMVAKGRQSLCDSLNLWHNQVKRDTAVYFDLQRRYFGGTFPTLAR